VTLLLARKINTNELERIVVRIGGVLLLIYKIKVPLILQERSMWLSIYNGGQKPKNKLKKKQENGVDGEEEGWGERGQKRRHGQGCRRWRRLGLGFAKGMKCLSLTPFALRRHLLLYIYNNTTIFGSLFYYNKLLFL